MFSVKCGTFSIIPNQNPLKYSILILWYRNLSPLRVGVRIGVICLKGPTVGKTAVCKVQTMWEE
jgi:hypothetical protein